MKARVALVSLCLLLLAGCYVRTKLQVQSSRIPSEFSSKVLVVAIRDRVGLEEPQLYEVEREAVEILSAQGIPATGVSEAVGAVSMERIREELKRQGYLSLLEIAVTSWGSVTGTVPDLPPASVETRETDRGSTLLGPGAVEESSYPGAETSYKEVAMTASLVDLETGRVMWSVRVNSRPALVGRSYLYHRFNRSLKYEDLAKSCLRKLAARLPPIHWQES